MAASFPAAIKSFSTAVNGVTKLVAALFNSPYDEITAIETELGTDPAGSLTDVKTRLAVSLNNDGTIKTDAVNTSNIKTTTGEVSGTANQYILTLPGGSYGFYPQVKADASVVIQTQIVGASGAGQTVTTSYVTYISFSYGGSGTYYAQQRYVTASGKDHWLFLLIDKITKDIISAWSAPDHPAYGNGGDFDKMPHPFGSYDEIKHEIILLDKETCLALKAESEQTSKSILTLVNEEYKPSIIEQVYQPLHSGKFLIEDNRQVRQMVTSIPDYIKVKKLIKLTNQEKQQRDIERQQKIQEVQMAKQTLKDNLKSKLGLTDKELDDLKQL